MIYKAEYEYSVYEYRDFITALTKRLAEAEVSAKGWRAAAETFKYGQQSEHDRRVKADELLKRCIMPLCGTAGNLGSVMLADIDAYFAEEKS